MLDIIGFVCFVMCLVCFFTMQYYDAVGREDDTPEYVINSFVFFALAFTAIAFYSTICRGFSNLFL